MKKTAKQPSKQPSKPSNPPKPSKPPKPLKPPKPILATKADVELLKQEIYGEMGRFLEKLTKRYNQLHGILTSLEQSFYKLQQEKLALEGRLEKAHQAKVADSDQRQAKINSILTQLKSLTVRIRQIEVWQDMKATTVDVVNRDAMDYFLVCYEPLNSTRPFALYKVSKGTKGRIIAGEPTLAQIRIHKPDDRGIVSRGVGDAPEVMEVWI